MQQVDPNKLKIGQVILVATPKPVIRKFQQKAGSLGGLNTVSIRFEFDKKAISVIIKRNPDLRNDSERKSAD